MVAKYHQRERIIYIGKAERSDLISKGINDLAKSFTIDVDVLQKRFIIKF